MGSRSSISVTSIASGLSLDSFLLYGTFGLLLFGPLAFGAVEPWSIFFLETGTVVLLLLWVAKQVRGGEAKVLWNPAYLPMAAFGVLVLAQLVLRRSAYAEDTVSGAVLYCAYGGLCFLVGQVLVRGAQARKLALIFTVYGAAVASFALLQGISSNGKLYWMRTPRLGGWIYGPYVNHNHYAGLMELLTPIPLVLSLTHLADNKQRIAAACTAAVMAGTVFLSGSRGGMLGIAVEIVLIAVILIKQQRGWRTAISMAAFLVIVIAALTWIGGGELGQRLATMGPAHSDLTSDMRLSINRDGLRMFLHRPILGWGLGTFPAVYPQYRTFYTNFFVNEAHNDYLQLLVEMGLLGFGVMLWFLVIVIRRALAKTKKWTSDMSGAVALACLLGLSGILVHSFVDFNLQIPANAALFYVLCTVASSAPFSKPARKRKAARPVAPEELTAEPVQQSATNF